MQKQVCTIDLHRQMYDVSVQIHAGLACLRSEVRSAKVTVHACSGVDLPGAGAASLSDHCYTTNEVAGHVVWYGVVFEVFKLQKAAVLVAMG